MLEEDYIHWQDYYRNNFVKRYDKLSEIRKEYIENYSEDNKITYFKTFENFFYAAIWLMHHYLWNNGVTASGVFEVIRWMYRTNYIDDGESWVIIETMFRRLQSGKIDRDKILEFALSRHYHIFEYFNNSLKDLIANEV